MLIADVNVTARPAAGILGVMALPISGAWKSIRRSVGGAPQKELGKARREMSEEMSAKVSNEERGEILKKFGESEEGTAGRKEAMKKKAKLFMTGDEKAFEEEMGVESGDKITDEKSSKSDDNTSKEGGGGAIQTTSAEMMKGEIMQGVQAQIAAEPEKGDELEEAEKRGYERAMKEIKRREAEEKGK